MNVNDNINMEYEARVMINEEQYLNIRNHYLNSNYPKRELVNENYYFDTRDLKLTDSHKVLRMRKINNDEYELTLKIQEKDGCLEMNYPLTSNEGKKLLEDNVISINPIVDKLLELGVKADEIHYITNLKTERLEVNIDDYLLVIDKNYFRGRIDYNLEVESCAETRSKIVLDAFISEYSLENEKDYINKAKRAIYNL